VTGEPGGDPPRGRVRVVRLPRGAGVLLAIPVLLAFGVATLAAFVIGLATILVAPRRRARTADPPEAADHDERTIVLDPGAYRRVDDARRLLDRRR
jgi:hypothetical protein